MSEKNEKPTKKSVITPKKTVATTLTPVPTAKAEEVKKAETPVEEKPAFVEGVTLSDDFIPGTQKGFADADLDNPKNAIPSKEQVDEETARQKIGGTIETIADQDIAEKEAKGYKNGALGVQENPDFKPKKHVFEKPVHASEKAHYEEIVKSNKETISSLRKQVADLQEELEATKVSK